MEPIQASDLPINANKVHELRESKQLNPHEANNALHVANHKTPENHRKQQYAHAKEPNKDNKITKPAITIIITNPPNPYKKYIFS